MKKKIFILLTVLTLALGSLACSVFVGGPAYPETPIPVSTEAVGSLEQMVQVAETAAAQNGLITLSITESQITSVLAARLEQQSDPFLTEPQVYLRENQMQVYGKITQGNLQANVRIVLAVTISAEGQPEIAVVSTDFGPFPAPEGLNSTISAFVQEAFTGALGPAAFGFRLETVAIADGVMTLTGRVK